MNCWFTGAFKQLFCFFSQQGCLAHVRTRLVSRVKWKYVLRSCWSMAMLWERLCTVLIPFLDLVCGNAPAGSNLKCVERMLTISLLNYSSFGWDLCRLFKFFKWNDENDVVFKHYYVFRHEILFRVSWCVISSSRSWWWSSTMLSAVTVISDYSRLHRVNCCCTTDSVHIIKVFLSAHLLNKM